MQYQIHNSPPELQPTSPAIPPTYRPLPSLPVIKSAAQVEFESFHKKNPHIYKKLVELARLAKRVGLGRYSIKSLFEQLRWHYLVEKNDEAFKLNNNYHSRYARLLMEQNRDLRGFFELRSLNEDFDSNPLVVH